MNTIQKSYLIAGIALSSSMVFTATCSAQTVVQPVPLNAPVVYGNGIRPSMPAAATVKHLGKGPIDRNNLPADILNCDVCRQRLGLPLLGSTSVEANVVPMLGSPGLISPRTAEQMALQGIVVEEFRPPQPEQDALRLGELPPEVRQQFMRSLDLPFGAKVMSAQIKGQPLAEEIKPESVEPSLDQPLVQTKSTIENTLPSQSQEQSAAHTKKQSELEKAALEKIALLNSERKSLEKERSKLNDQLVQMQVEWKKRMEQADAANREALTLLERRTGEVTELQLQLKSQQEALAKAQQEAQSKDKPESKKKAPNKGKEKGKKPEKTIDT